jgi:hypothetical protein
VLITAPAGARSASPDGRVFGRLPLGFLGFFALFAPVQLLAGGPKYVAGTTYFDPAVLGVPVHWAGGQVNYYVDQGPLSSTVTNAQATTMVDAAAALWSAVPTAGVTLTDMGALNEDVNGADIQVNSSGQIIAPADITPAATDYPIAVIYDADGSVINAIFGATTSQPDACQNNGVYVWIDNFNTNATFAHGVILLNGLCATNANMIEMMSFELERAFGRILGLDDAQVNPQALSGGETGGTLGWPVMEPMSGECGASGGACIPDPTVLRSDDIAAVNRMYPITAANLAIFPGKQLTAPNTISIEGTVSFRTGYGMQGVNVVARPLDSNGNPLYEYTVTAVTGALFNGNHGNPVTGWDDASGNLLTNWGSNDPSLQGFFDLSGIPLPPGVVTANYQVRGHQSALYSRKLRWALHPGASCALGHAQRNLATQPLRGQHGNPHRQLGQFRCGRIFRRHWNRGPAACDARGRPVVRAFEPGGPDGLVHFSGARQSHFYSGNAGAG